MYALFCQVSCVGWWYFPLFQFHRTNAQYHKIFKDISENELLKQSKQTVLTINSMNKYKVKYLLCFHVVCDIQIILANKYKCLFLT